MNISMLTTEQIAQAVHEYNRRYGEMERALWCLSRHCRESLLSGQSTSIVESLVWTIKSWWGVQGVRKETKTFMAKALSQMTWTPDLFDPPTIIPTNAEVFARNLVTTLVSTARELGAFRQEYSLASKTLHWLLPWRIPVYDGFVRSCLNIPVSWDHRDAYLTITQKLFLVARKFAGEDASWIGRINPTSPLRALDKYFWWYGGGKEAQSASIRDPWQVVDQLGLARN